MEDVYKRVVSKGRFNKLISEYNLSGSPTTATASGANPGTLPVTPQPSQATGGMDPKIIAAKKASTDAAKKAAQAELDALKKADPLNKKRMKELQDIASGKLQPTSPV